MSEFINEINKITLQSTLEVANVNMTTLLFSDNLIQPKTTYTITENMLFLKDQAQTNVDLFQFVDTSQYYEFLTSLKTSYTSISGNDRYGNTLSNLSDTVLVFVNGYKLSSSEYIVDSEKNSVIIKPAFTEKSINNVIIYTSSDTVYEGNVEDDFSWDSEFNQFTLKDYTIERYIFFKNGELLPPNKIQKVGNYVRLNTTIRHGIDVVEYYRMSKDCYALTFIPTLGYLTYGPKDDRGALIQNPYNCIVTFENISRLIVDDIRTGFFIHEANGEGCVMIVDDDFEKCSVKCLVIRKFSKESLEPSEYFITVPDAPTILKYVSQYDLNGTLFKELMVSFQKVLLNETYDTIQRLKNIRNINKVDSTNISALINFLGLQINVTNLTLEKKHNLIEELRSFYNTVGTRASYNFYNAFRDNGKILNIQQLFTPIKSTETSDTIQTFFPKRWGELQKVEQTYSQNEDKNDYVYTWSMHFENGILPVILGKNATTPKFDFTLFETIGDDEINSAVYNPEDLKWLNATASDEEEYMCWKYLRNNVVYHSHLPYGESLEKNWWKWSASQTIINNTQYKSYTYTSEDYDIPYYYGELQNAICTATPNESRGDWVYILSLHFSNGTLPIKVYHHNNSFDLDLNYFTSDTNQDINSMVYTGGKWVNSIAKDEHSKNCMVWYDQNNVARRVIDYMSATIDGWNDGHDTVYSNALSCFVDNGIITIKKWENIIGTLSIEPEHPYNTNIFILDETPGSPVYDSNCTQIGTLTSCNESVCIFNGYSYLRSDINDFTHQDASTEVYYKYTKGESVEDGVCYEQQEEANPIHYTEPTGETFKIDDLIYSVVEKDDSTPTLETVHTGRFFFTINENIFTAQDTETGTSLGSWTFYLKQEDQEGQPKVDPVKRYVTFRTAEELNASLKQKYITETVDFGQVSELALDGGVNLSNTPRYDGVLRYSNYPALLEGKIDRYHPTENGPVLRQDNIILSLIINSTIRIAKISEDNNYECEFDEEAGQIILKKYLGTNSKVTVPETLTYENKKMAELSAFPSNLTIDLYDKNNKKVRLYDYDEETCTFKYLLEDNVEYYYKVLDKSKNVVFTHDLEDGNQTISTLLPLINDYTTSPQLGPNKPTIDCGYITDTPVDFYDFGSVSEQLDGHWVSWYEWDRPKNWYPTNHVDISVEIPVTIDYETFMNIFKDTFYEMASAVLYIHQITQIYMFGDPNNTGLTEVQPMSLLTTCPYETEEQCFTTDHEFLPYKKSISNPPLTLKSYSWKNPVYEFIDGETMKVSVDLYKNFGRDEYLYKTTGEEKDIEWTETIVGYLPCKQLNYTDWTEEQVEATQTTGDVSWTTLKTIPTYTVTCTPNENRTDWLYCLVINYDDRDEGYLISQDLQSVERKIISQDVNKLQTIIDGDLRYVRPNSMFYEKGTWYLGYVTKNTEFSTFEWKLATLPEENPEDYIEEDDDGIAQFSFYEAALINLNLGRYENIIVDSKSEYENNKLRISVDVREELYKTINDEFDINESEFQQDYSYTHNNITWSCKLKKYNVTNTVQLENTSIENGSTILLPTEIFYKDENIKLAQSKPLSCDFAWLFGDIQYNFTKLDATLEEESEVESGDEEKTYWRYTNYLASEVDNSQLNFNTYGTLLTSKQIIFKDIDYLCFGFDHLPGHGSHLDVFVRITNSKNANYNRAVGFYASEFTLPSNGIHSGNWNTDVPYDETKLMQWCRHNQGNHEGSPWFYTGEDVIINITNFSNNTYKNYFDDEIKFDLYCAINPYGHSGQSTSHNNLEGLVASEDISINARGYKNGTIKWYPASEVDSHNIYKYENVDDQGNVVTPVYQHQEPLHNFCITEMLGTRLSADSIPENTSHADVLRKVATIIYTQSTKEVKFEITPKENS